MTARIQPVIAVKNGKAIDVRNVAPVTPDVDNYVDRRSHICGQSSMRRYGFV